MNSFSQGHSAVRPLGPLLAHKMTYHNGFRAKTSSILIQPSLSETVRRLLLSKNHCPYDRLHKNHLNTFIHEPFSYQIEIQFGTNDRINISLHNILILFQDILYFSTTIYSIF